MHHLYTYLSVQGQDNIFCKRKKRHYKRHASQWSTALSDEIAKAIILIPCSSWEEALFAGTTFDTFLIYSTGKTTGGHSNKEKRRVIREMEGEVHNPSFQQLIQIASSTINQNETTRDSNAKRRHKRNVRIRCKSSVKLTIDYAS